MVKKLSAVGNSPGLIIERPILELLNITKDTPLEVKTDGEALMKRNGRVPVLVPSPRLLHEMPLVPVPAAATFS